MARGDVETHTATVGPGDPAKEPTSYLGKIVASLESPSTDQKAVYPSDPPTTPADLTPTIHGKGFRSMGALDSNPSPLPQQSQARFAAAGTYTVYCIIHPFMKGTITAQ